jgi:hypothetical protein
MNPTSAPTEKKAITIFVIIHDDVPESTRKNLYADHFQPFITELQSFIERKVHVIFGRLAPYSNFDYKNENEQMTSSRWENMCFGYLEERRAEGFKTDRLTKVLLVTNENLNSRTGGIARIYPPFFSGNSAIASLTSYINVAHEIGHLLGAKHEDYETQFNGWWCETNMSPRSGGITSNCYVFSPANRQNIKNYLASVN